MENADSTRKPFHLIIYILFGILLLSLIIWSSIRLLRETPKREVNLQLPDQGWVNFSFTTDPFPPLATGSVEFLMAAMNSNNMMVNFGQSLPFALGAKGTTTPLDTGLAQYGPTGYHGGIQFPAPGDYWVRFEVGSGNVVEFLIYVEPAQ